MEEVKKLCFKSPYKKNRLQEEISLENLFSFYPVKNNKMNYIEDQSKRVINKQTTLQSNSTRFES